ncbi:MAG: DUF3943 domain-containing protein [Chitinophagales bacterium]|nr:DUF3943 domain-containing protein [Chitinophagales bacterium]
MTKFISAGILMLVLFTVTSVYGQSQTCTDTFSKRLELFRKATNTANGNAAFSWKSSGFTTSHKASPVSFPNDTLPLPQYNPLRDDDPLYNRRYPLWIPIAEVPLTNGLIWSFDRYIFNDKFAYINGETIKNNFKNGWEWDTDDFPTNFSLHPYTGSIYYNAARSNGYNFYQSVPFVLGGSLMWELFMENTKPSYNDLINTTVSGIFLGEVIYRLSSSILDDRKTGKARLIREIACAVIDPARGFNRVIQGKASRVTMQDVYQKEPLFLTIAGGLRQVNNGTNITTGAISALLDFDFIYGNPFELRLRKPFDFFHLRTDLNFGNTKAIVNNVIGEGFLFGTNTNDKNKMKMLVGAFQHYDYWNTDSFEIGTIGFGGGVVSRMAIFKNCRFQNQLYLALVPLGASNSRKVQKGDINFDYKNYTFSGGAQIKFQSNLNFGHGQLAAAYYLYWLHTFVGRQGNNLLGIFQPSIRIKLYHTLNVGYEYLWYLRDDYRKNARTLHVRTGEQRLFLLFDFENF